MRKAIVFGIAAIPVALAIGPAMKAYGPALEQAVGTAPAGTTVAAADPAGKIGPERSHAAAKAKAAAAAKARKVAKVHGHGANPAQPTSDGSGGSQQH